MNGWTKLFIDNTKYVGSDTDPHRTWRNSRSDGQVGVVLEHHPVLLTIVGTPGTYWQSDDFQVCPDTLTPTIVCRRIQKYIDRWDHFVGFRRDGTSLFVRFFSSMQGNHVDELELIRPVLPSETGKWLTEEYNILTGDLSISYLDQQR